MRTTTPSLRNSIFVFFVALALMAFSAEAQDKPAAVGRVLKLVDNTDRVILKGNMHPLARSEFDRGRVSDDLPMERMLLVLQRSPEQDAALKELMSQQTDAAAPNFHKWLTPEQFGAQFGPADSDIAAVTSWLKESGFQVARVSKGKLAIEFSGTAGQLRSAFHTEIHKYAINGEMHLANAYQPEIPAALAPVIKGFVSLHDFRPKPAHHVLGKFVKPLGNMEATGVTPELTNGGNYFIGPTDFATIYNVLPLWNAATPVDGTGQSIAVIGISNINLQDVRDFRSFFGLPAKDPIVVIDGTDPGISTDGSEVEALLDVEWAGAVAKNAQIHLVTAADTNDVSGLFLAVFNVIDNNSDPVMTLSFGNCESSMGASFVQSLGSVWEQAAAQGITVTISTGDTGADSCADQNANPPNRATGLQVSGFASSPFNVAVGGTDFDDSGIQSTYFKTTNDSGTHNSALSYIPESTWNDSCTNSKFGSNAATNCTAPANSADVITVAGSGGASTVFVKPSYQQLLTTANGMPADGKRDLPDVSLFASDGFNKSSYVVCNSGTEDSTDACLKNGNFSFIGVGGTSASTPAFAGIVALINQSETAHSRAGRQGNLNYVLYQLAKNQFQAATACGSATPPAGTCTFNDVTKGTIAMPCTGSSGCTNGVQTGFAATAGYDLATGLGSINAANLVNNWGTGLAALTPTTQVTLTINNGSSSAIVHGTSVPVTVSVTPTTATGDVALVSTATTGQGVDGFTLGAGGTVTTTTDQLTGGTYTVKAHYPGNGVLSPLDSNSVAVTVNPQNSLTAATVLNSAGQPVSSGAAPLSIILRADVIDSNQIGDWVVTGTVKFVDTSTTPATTLINSVPLNSFSEAFSNPITLAAGTHKIVAQYSGDPSFNGSNSAAVTVTVTGGSPTYSTSGTAATITAGASGTSTVSVTPTNGVAPGIVSITCTSASLPPGVTCSPSPLSINGTSTTAAATGTLTINVAGPSASTSAAIRNPTLFAVAGVSPSTPTNVKGWWTLSVTAGFAAVLILILPGRKHYRSALGLSLACALCFALGCGGGGSSSGGGGGGGNTPAATTTALSLSSTKVPSTGSLTVTVNVTSTGATPTGSVQFFDNGVALGAAQPLSSGSFSTTLTSASAPINVVGTHAISAHYTGATGFSASTSGTLNVTVTGNTTVALTASPAAASATPINLTIQ